MLILSAFVKGSSGNPVFLAGGCVFNSQELLRNHVEHARIVCIHFHATTRSPARPRRFSTISNSGCAQPNPRWSADAKNEQIIFRHWPMPQCRKIKTFVFQGWTFRCRARSLWHTIMLPFGFFAMSVAAGAALPDCAHLERRACRELVHLQKMNER